MSASLKAPAAPETLKGEHLPITRSVGESFSDDPSLISWHGTTFFRGVLKKLVNKDSKSMIA